MTVPDRTTRTHLALAATLLSGEDDGPLPGSVSEQFIRCVKPGCHCWRGQLHGPYFYRIWRDAPQAGGKKGKGNKVYVKAADVAGVRARYEEYRVMGQELRALRARRVALTTRLRLQVRRSRRLRLPAL